MISIFELPWLLKREREREKEKEKKCLSSEGPRQLGWASLHYPGFTVAYR